MRVDGWNYSIEFEDTEFTALFCPRNQGIGGYYEAADTEEMAVALATLRAKGVEL